MGYMTGQHYLHTDHLGSTALVTAGNGAVANRQGYAAYGEKRHGDDLLTDHNFTAPKGPPKRDATGLLYYQAMGNMPNLM